MSSPPPTSGTGGSAGLLTAYAQTAAASVGVATVLVSVTVGAGAWYDVQVWNYNIAAATDGTPAQDALNLGLWSDPVTASSMVLQTVIPWNFYHMTGGGGVPVPYQMRVYAQSTISIQSFQAATASTIYANVIAVRLANDVSPFI